MYEKLLYTLQFLFTRIKKIFLTPLFKVFFFFAWFFFFSLRSLLSVLLSIQPKHHRTQMLVLCRRRSPNSIYLLSIAALCHRHRSLPSPPHLGLGLCRSLLHGSWPTAWVSASLVVVVVVVGFYLLLLFTCWLILDIGFAVAAWWSGGCCWVLDGGVGHRSREMRREKKKFK